MPRSVCLLCEVDLLPGPDLSRQLHPDTIDCTVRLTDAWGVAVDDEVLAQSKPAEPEGFSISSFPFVDEVLEEIFDAAGIPRLGGMSSGRGWSSFSTFQRCPYAWERRYLKKARPVFLVEPPALAVGSLIHTFLAVHYMQMIDASYPLTADIVNDRVKLKCNPKFTEQAWKVFSGYRLYYKHEQITPLAIEYDLKDPRSGESCRYDLIAYFPEWIAGRAPGTYLVEHKSAARFDQDTLEGWVNDGEVIGEVALWKKLGLDHRFGKLQGIIVNILGKQPKEPQYHRTLVSPDSWQIEQHLLDLKRWEGLIQLARSTGSFPRARQGCIGRYGRCEWFDHCAHKD